MKLLALILFAAQIALAAQTDDPSTAADIHYQEGYRLLKQAEQGATASERIAGLQSTARELRAAIALRPDYYLARALLAQTLFGLTRELTDPAARQQTIDQTWEQFSAAAKLPEADWRIFNAWGRFLTFIAPGTTDRLAVLQEARQLFERALSLARWSNEKSAVNVLYGQCFYNLALATPASAPKRQYLTEASERLKSATKELPFANDVTALRTLGDAMAELGRLDRDPATIRQATVPLESALALAARNPETHYSIARVHALLQENDEAVNQLRQSLEIGVTNLAAMAQDDPAFADLRDRQDFRQALTTGHNAIAAEPLLRECLELSTSTNQLAQAVECFRKVAQLQPDSADVHRLWAETLMRLAQNTGSNEARRAFAAEASQRIAVAGAAPNADWHVYYSWGRLLGYLADTFPEAQRTERLRDATDKFETGLRRTKVAEDRRLLQCELAGNLLARATESRADRATLLSRCINLCEELAPTKTSPDGSRINAIWGRALMVTGKIESDRMKLRLAAEKLADALELDPQSSDLEYRLATIYALLDNKTQALRHLGMSLEQDPTGRHHRDAAQDSDLDKLRALPEFYELLGQKTDR